MAPPEGGVLGGGVVGGAVGGAGSAGVPGLGPLPGSSEPPPQPDSPSRVTMASTTAQRHPFDACLIAGMFIVPWLLLSFAEAAILVVQGPPFGEHDQARMALNAKLPSLSMTSANLFGAGGQDPQSAGSARTGTEMFGALLDWRERCSETPAYESRACP